MNKFFLTIISLWLLCLFSCKEKTLFKKIASSHSGLTFNNEISIDDSINPIEIVNIYNGGGVGIGDFNNDGLQDIYFTGNMVSNKLYLNKGDFKFDDVTEAAAVEGMGRWGRGVAIVDINNDGLMDMYVCNTIHKDSLQRRNILYVNQGIDGKGIPHFKDMAAEYGLAIHLQSTMANFFDYDNDGDLDVYVTVNEASSDNNPSAFGPNRRKRPIPSVGKLYRNDMNNTWKHAVYQDVSDSAGITLDGYGHGAIVADLNLDGWKDIYVANDFMSSNILYINNRDGTFTDRSKEYFKHTSYNAMGLDVIDISNDGLADVFELDMNPPDNYRKKMMLSTNNYNIIQNFEVYGYQYQYVRNTLQLNNGPRLLENDSIGPPIFSEISFMSGVAQTDWSWAPLITDFDNDAFRDIIITNGFPKDVSDHDFIAYREESRNLVSKKDLLDKVPEIKLHNYAFQNTNGLRFNDVSADWGFSETSFSNGGAYADLDNDGDLDVVINNINDEAFVYQNTLRQNNDTSSNYLQVTFEGSAQNRDGIGAVISIYYGGNKQQVFEHTPFRGYLSTNQNIAHFGLGNVSVIDSVVVHWTMDEVQVLKNVKANQVITVKMSDAELKPTAPASLTATAALFREITLSSGIDYKHRAFDFIDFNIQTTLPHKLSEYAPALVAGDVDGNGLDDLIIGGNFDWRSKIFLQQPTGEFVTKNLSAADAGSKEYQDAGLLLIDVNGDGALDLYAAGGGYKFKKGTSNYADRLYLNDGKGNFAEAANALPQNFTSKLCVRAMDYNNDGKPDIFVSGRVDPWSYPKPVSSFIYRNDSDKDHIKFTDVTNEVAPMLKDIGMICDAIFSDFDNDLKPDLILAGEWMPVTFLKNVNGKFINTTAASGISNKSGWWNSITAGDFRHTGRTDYIVGNVGLNTLYQASDEHPVHIIAKDFDNNGSFVPIPSLFLPDQKGKLKEFPANGRDEIVERIPTMKKRFNHYNSFAKSSLDEILTDAQKKGALRLTANMLQSCLLRNDGNGKFTMIPLPEQAQVSTLNGMITDDYDGDGHLDVLLSGNDFGTEVSVGRYDALNGLLLKGDGKGGFKPLSILQSGIYLPGDTKALVKLRGTTGKYLVASSEFKGPLKLFSLRKDVRTIPLLPTDLIAITRYKNGTTKKEECYYGNSFLSQSARFVTIDKNVDRITITNSKGQSRIITN